MKNLLVTFLAILSISVYGQDEKRHLIGGGFSPEATYRTLPNAGVFNDIESFGFGFTVGAAYSYQKKWFWAIETGVYFSVKSILVDYSALSFGNQIDPRRGFIYNTGDGPSVFSSQTNYIEIPIKFNFYFTESKVKPFVGIGINNGFFVGNMRRYKPVQRPYQTFPFVFMMQGIASVGVDFDFSNKITFRVEPQFKHAFLTINENGNLYKEYPYSIGCMFALYYRFGN